MIEIPIWILFTITITALGLGVTIGFKVAEKKPEVLESVNGGVKFSSFS